MSDYYDNFYTIEFDMRFLYHFINQNVINNIYLVPN